MIQMVIKLTQFKYVNLKNKSFNFFSSLKNEQVLSEVTKIGINIKKEDIFTIFNIRGNYNKKIFKDIFQKHLKHKIPTQLGSFSDDKKAYILNLGPDELLYVSKSNKVFPPRSMEAQLKKNKFSITDVSYQFKILSLQGSEVRWVLSKGCPLNFDIKNFHKGKCFQSILGNCNVTIFCTADDHFLLIFITSFSDYIVNWLKESSYNHGYKFIV